MKTCILCGNNLATGTLTGIEQITDYSLTHQLFNTFHCKNCELSQTDFEDFENIHRYYDSSDYASHELKENNPIHIGYKIARLFTTKKKTTLVEKLADQKTLLDYGCGTGYFLKHLKDTGWEVDGVEPNEKARTKATKQVGQPIKQDVKELGRKYKIITLWHVLEHVPDPKGILEELKKLLDTNGAILIAVPNSNSWDAHHYGKYWAGYDVPRHLWHFSRKAIDILASKSHLQVTTVDPMKLDAFYVSLLSEKYINNKQTITGFLNAIRNGIKSNKAATKTGEYSSLIYTLK